MRYKLKKLQPGPAWVPWLVARARDPGAAQPDRGVGQKIRTWAQP